MIEKITGKINISTTKPDLTKSDKRMKVLYCPVLFSLILWTRGSRKKCG